MEIVVGSENIPKKLAVEQAFKQLWPDELLDIHGVSAESGVSSHPVSAEESLQGARQRIAHARNLQPGADYYVGIEGGLLQVGDTAWELGWVAIENSKGDLFTAPSAGVEVRGKILEAIRAGQELSDILAEDFDIHNAGQTNGFYGIVTDDALTRNQGYEQAVILALAPFKNPQYFQ